MMPAIIDVSLAMYLKYRHLYHYKSSPRIDRIMIDAYRLAEDYDQDVHALFVVWSMLRIHDSITHHLLVEFGVTEDLLREACAVPSIHMLDLNRLFASVVSHAQAQGDITLGTEHLLMALLSDTLLQCQLTNLGIDVNGMRQAALSIRETDR